MAWSVVSLALSTNFAFCRRLIFAGARGVIGEILRRECLYASQVASWKNSLEEVITKGLPEKLRGRRKDPALAYKQKAEKFERALARANERLREARLIIEAQKNCRDVQGRESGRGERRRLSPDLFPKAAVSCKVACPWSLPGHRTTGACCQSLMVRQYPDQGR